MKVNSPLANVDVRIGSAARRGHLLVLRSSADSPMQAEITIGPGEVLRTLLRVLLTPASLLFVVGLPVFWLLEMLRDEAAGGAASHEAATRPTDINKPW